MPKVFARTIVFKPMAYKSNGVELTIYDGEEVSWREIEINETDRDKLIDKMVIEASTMAYQNKIDEGYSFVCMEIPGIEVIEGEGDYSRAETVFYPKPVQAHKIVFYKSDGGKAVPVKEIVIERGKYIYDGYITVDSLDFDLIEIHTSNGTRMLLKEELKIPSLSKVAIATETQKKAKRKRRRKRKTSTKTKKAEKKSKKKTTKKKRKKRKKKSKSK